MQFRHTTLPNGLTIIGEVNDAAHTCAVGFFVKTGSRDEVKSVMGVSHFLEHMMFKGTERRTAADVNRDFDRIGANYNASTSQETTAYWAHVLPEYLPQAIDLLGDILRPSLRVEDFDMEKNVILEEIGMYDDRPFWVAYEKAMERYFGEHTLGFRILGTTDSIRALKRDQMMDYFNERYSPNNIVVSLAGKIDFDRCAEMIDKACGSWKPMKIARKYVAAKPTAAEELLHKKSANMHYVLGVSEAPSAQDEMRYAAAVLANVLGDNDGSRLYWDLIDPGLADEAEVAHHPFDRTGVFMYYISCPPGQAARVEGILEKALDEAAAKLKSDEIERAVSKIAMDLMLQNERPAGRMMGLGGQWIYLQRYESLEAELERIKAVDVDAVRALIEKYPFRPRTLVRLTPGD
ncbi:MAG: insulinase family protein [Planctomycetes bacterium]|nr:insulinase family protein [Planctomycetota bacterium]